MAREAVEPHRVYELAEVAELLGLNIRKVRQIIKDGQLPRLTYSRHIRVLGEDLLAFIRSTRSTGGSS